MPEQGGPEMGQSSQAKEEEAEYKRRGGGVTKTAADIEKMWSLSPQLLAFAAL